MQGPTHRRAGLRSAFLTRAQGMPALVPGPQLGKHGILLSRAVVEILAPSLPEPLIQSLQALLQTFIIAK